jgi:hypothetical protein
MFVTVEQVTTTVALKVTGSSKYEGLGLLFTVVVVG